MINRIDLKITTATNHWYTGFNGTMEEAISYFLGTVFEGQTPVIRVEDVKAPIVPVFGLAQAYRPYICTVCGHRDMIQTNHTDDIHTRCNSCSWKGAGYDITRKDIPTKGQALGSTDRRFVYCGRAET